MAMVVKYVTSISSTATPSITMRHARRIATDLKIKINETKLRMIICPAVIFANKRIIKAKGLVNIPIISIGTIIGYKALGTGGIKI